MQQLKKLQKTYKTKEVSAIVGIADSTVRKYSQELENIGYSFLKNKNGNRLFLEKDLDVLEKMKKCRSESNLSLNYIAKIVKDSEMINTPKRVTHSMKLTGMSQELAEIEISSKIDEILKEHRLLRKELKELKEYLELDLRINKERDQQLISLLEQFKSLNKRIVFSKEKGNFLKKYLK